MRYGESRSRSGFEVGNEVKRLALASETRLANVLQHGRTCGKRGFMTHEANCTCLECYGEWLDGKFEGNVVIDCNFCEDVSIVQNPDSLPRIDCPNCGISNSVPRD